MPGSPISSRRRSSRSRPSRRTTTLRPPTRTPGRPSAPTSTTRSTCAPRTTRWSPPSSKPPRPSAPRRRPPASPRRRPRRPPQGRGRRGRRRRRRRRQAGAPPPRSPRRARPLARRDRRARGHLRPRRGGLRPVARPRRHRQPDLRRALGGPPARRGHRRGGPDRDPPRRRRRRRLTTRTSRARSPGSAARTSRSRSASSRCATGSPCFDETLPLVYLANLLWVTAGPGDGRRRHELIADADRLLAAFEHRWIVVDREPLWRMLTDEFAAAGWGIADARVHDARRAPDRSGPLDTVERGRTRRPARAEMRYMDEPAVVHDHRAGTAGARAQSASRRAARRALLRRPATATTSSPTRSCATATAIAQVEDVVVLEGHRGSGLGRLVTTAALPPAWSTSPSCCSSSPTTTTGPRSSTRRLGFEPRRAARGCSTACRRRGVARLRLGAPAAGEVARVAQVAQERRVGDGARVPGPRRAGRDRGGEVGAPVRSARRRARPARRS